MNVLQFPKSPAWDADAYIDSNNEQIIRKAKSTLKPGEWAAGLRQSRTSI